MTCNVYKDICNWAALDAGIGMGFMPIVSEVFFIISTSQICLACKCPCMLGFT